MIFKKLIIMKKLIPAAVLAVIFASQVANAQTGESTNKITAVDYILASQAAATAQHATLLDKMQQETEQLFTAITPSPVLSLAKLIEEKLQPSATEKQKAQNCDLQKAPSPTTN